MAGHAYTERPPLVDEMLDPGFYPDDPPSVEFHETHISWVFVAGELAFKVKKPLTFPFLDYSTPERRREMCREEVRLNRRLAPEIYLDVVGIASEGGGYALVSEEDPSAVEYAVRMRRIDENRCLAQLLETDEAGGAIEGIARRLRRFHREAAMVGPERDPVGSLVAAMEENFQTLRETGGEILPPARIEAAESFTRRYLDARMGLLEQRVADGLAREGHGDLRAEHVIVPRSGEPYVFDCIEFDASKRDIDIGCDLGFLVMDLVRLGAEGSALELVEAYRRDGGDPGDDSLIAFFAAYRAWVRSKIAVLRALELKLGDREREDSEAKAAGLFDLGHRFAWRARRPLLIVVGGVSASGKSTLAEELATLGDLPYISSDVTRKRLAGMVPTERGSQDLYGEEMTLETYHEIGRLAAEALSAGKGAIVDATFHRAAHGRAFDEGLGDYAGRRVGIECTASPETLAERARRRLDDPERASDADPEVARRQLASREPDSLPAQETMTLDTEAPADRLLTQVEAFIDSGLSR